MGLGGISIWQLTIVLLIVALIFGTAKLRSLGGDLGGAIKGFKNALDDQSLNEPEEMEMDMHDSSEPINPEQEKATQSQV